MTPGERDFIVSLCAARAGLRIDAGKAYLLESRLAPVARREGYASAPEFVRAVRDRAEERLVWAMVEALAPAQSGFFRDPAVFEAVAGDLPSRLRAGQAGPLRIWSAGCGAGQEAYSLAMLLEERGIEGVEVLASDLGERALEKARSGLYSQVEVQQGLSARRLVRHFENQDDAFAVSPKLRQGIRWRRINLLDARLPADPFDVILCRYVLGSMLEPARQRVLAGLAQDLRPGGVLVLGADEPLAPAAAFVPRPGPPGLYELSAAAVRAAA